ncbi:hypothetical protein MOQ_002251 [Trypanosoma cruzi marinkellei]|uniref:Uncharacterized protein n=1 Tax=Trypanosoma cruzi marinkellei TaxID=85056 RepID=K2P7P4_TRYCR|nr:hypothetical protein MOQ_002251 [Trypanosoma cruzi marinkellei]
MAPRMRAAGIRQMSLLRRLASVTGRWASRSGAFFPGLRRGMMTPRRQFRGTVPACGRLLDSRGTARFATRPTWRSASPCVPSAPGAGPKGNSRGMRLRSAIVTGVKSLAFVGIGGGGLDFGCRVAFAAHGFIRWLTFWRLLSTVPPDFTAGALREQGAYTRSNACRLLPPVASSMVRSVRLPIVDAPRGASLRRTLSRSLRSAWGAAAVVRYNSASPGVQNGDGWRLPAGTVALVAFCIPDAMCLSVLPMLVNSRGILQSWLVAPLRLFQFAFPMLIMSGHASVPLRVFHQPRSGLQRG